MRLSVRLTGLSLISALISCTGAETVADSSRDVPRRPVLGEIDTLPTPRSPEPHEGSEGWPVLGGSIMLPAPPQFGSREASALPECSARPAVISRDSLGPIPIDLSVSAFFAFCPAASRRWIPDGEDGLEPGTYVRLGESVVEVVFEDTLQSSRIRRFDVSDSLAHFQSGLRPGATLVSAASEFGKPRAILIECGLWVSFENAPGIAAWLRIPGIPDCERRGAAENAINAGQVDGTILIAGFRVFRPGT